MRHGVIRLSKKDIRRIRSGERLNVGSGFHIEYDSTLDAPGDADLLDVCRKFVDDNKIRCAETVYQCDRVAENSLELVHDIAKLMGFYEEKDDG